MIKIDKSINESRVYVTLSELSVGISPTYSLELFNNYTSVTYNYPVYVASTTDRIDTIDIVLDEELEGKILVKGDYNYKFYQVIGTSSTIVEKGLAYVIDSSTYSVLLENTFDESSDDYISYEG